MQRNNIFERFKNIDVLKEQCLKNKTSYFISNHESSTELHNNRTDESFTGVIVLNDAEGPDSAYLFVNKDADFQIGDYFTWKTTTFFAYEEVRVVKDVDYIKYKILECNVFVNDSFWAYFKSTLTTIKDSRFSHNTETSAIMSALIAPRNEMLQIGSSLYFNDQAWNITDGDIFTITNIGYYYLDRATNARTEEEVEELELEYGEEWANYFVNSTITADTEMGYYKALHRIKADDGSILETPFKVELKSRLMNTITICPLEAGEMILQTLKENQVIETTFVIKEYA